MRPPPPPALRLANITRSYRQGRARLEVFRGLALSVRPGERVALVGPSGAGKSSLLHIAGLLEAPDEGEVHVAGRDCTRLSDDARTELRRETIGFVYQFHHLLPEFSAIENVAMPLVIAGETRRVARERAGDLLHRLGLGERLDHRPAELSGGEQQRVAIARAVANRPALLLADEPTGNLDPRTADSVYAELARLIDEEALTVLLATHNHDLASRMDRVLRLEEGRLVEETPST